MRIFERPRQSPADTKLLDYLRRFFPNAELISPEECGCEWCQPHINRRKGGHRAKELKEDIAT